MKTEIVFILDRSGSMNSIKNDAIGGFNAFLEEQQKAEGEANLTLVLFDTIADTVVNSKDIREVEPLSSKTYKPSGGTALLDAIGQSIEMITNKEETPEQVIFAILTDGEENSSREFSRKEIFRLISTLRKFSSFEFLFLGANQDAIGEATSIGISAINSATISNLNADSIKGGYMAFNGAITAYRTTGEVSANWSKDVK